MAALILAALLAFTSLFGTVHGSSSRTAPVPTGAATNNVNPPYGL